MTHRRVLIVGEHDSVVRLLNMEGGHELRDVIGGFFEPVLGDRYRMYLDDEGGRKKLFVNERAGALARALGYRGGDAFRGPVVFFGALDGNVPGFVLGAAYSLFEIIDAT
jgi:hypothetical protein